MFICRKVSACERGFMKKVFLLSKDNSWSNSLYEKLFDLDLRKEIELYYFIENNITFFMDGVKQINPDYIFFFHWSEYISKEIYENYNCISFHTSNLPNGRGGTPIQNQILDGIIKTKVNAIKTCQEIDAGDIFCSEEITLQGNLRDIWHTIADMAFLMIKKIIDTNPIPIHQIKTNLTAEPYRRNLNNVVPFNKAKNMESIYRFIQMLDGEQYENAYIDIGNYKLSFSRAGIRNDNVIADVLITKRS